MEKIIKVDTGLTPDLEHIAMSSHETSKGVEALILQNEKNNPLPALESIMVNTDKMAKAMDENFASTKEDKKSLTKMSDFLEQMKGDKGEKGDKGDKHTDEELLKLIKPLIVTPKDGKDGTNGKDGVNGKDGKNGRDGLNGYDGKDGRDGKDGKDGEKGKDGTELTPQQLRGIFSKMDDSSKLSFDDLKDADSIRQLINKKNLAGGSSYIHEIADVMLTNLQDGQVLKYNKALNKWVNGTAGGSGSAIWGDITGTLSDQSDLITALNFKANSADLATVAFTGAYSDLTGVPVLTGFVPYTGATGNVNLGANNLTTLGQLNAHFLGTSGGTIFADINTFTIFNELSTPVAIFTSSQLALINNGGNHVLDWGISSLVDNGGTVSLRWDSRQLTTYTTPFIPITVLDWSAGQMYDLSSVEAIDWFGRSLVDMGGISSINWQNRIAYDLSGTQMIHWEFAYLSDATGLSINWTTRQGYTTTGEIAFDWSDVNNIIFGNETNSHGLFLDSSTGTTTLKSYGIRQLSVSDSTGIQAFGDLDFDYYGDKLVIDNGARTTTIYDLGSDRWFQIDYNVRTVSLGDIDSTLNNTKLVIDDTAQTITSNKTFIAPVLQTSQILDSFTNTFADVDARLIFDNSIVQSIDANNRFLENSSGNETVDWENQQLVNQFGSPFPIVDWKNALFNDLVGLASIDADARQLFALGVITPSLDYGNYLLFDSGGVPSINWGSHALYNTSAINVVKYGGSNVEVLVDLQADANINISTKGKTLTVASGGPSAKAGTATLGAGGTVTIPTTGITATSKIFLSAPRGTLVNLGVHKETARIAGTSFTIGSLNVLDLSTFDWWLVE